MAVSFVRVNDGLSALPSPALYEVFEYLTNADDVVALATSCGGLFERTWNDEAFWHEQFDRLYGPGWQPTSFTTWRRAVFTTRRTLECPPQQTQQQAAHGNSSDGKHGTFFRRLVGKMLSKLGVAPSITPPATPQLADDPMDEVGGEDQQATGGGDQMIIAALLGVPGCGRSALLKRVQSWKGLLLHPMSCSNGECTCTLPTGHPIRKRFTVGARIGAVPQNFEATQIMEGAIAVVMLIESNAPSYAIDLTQESLIQIAKLIRLSKKKTPVLVMCNSRPSLQLPPPPPPPLRQQGQPQPQGQGQGREAYRTPYQLSDRLGLPRILKDVLWVCREVDSSTGAGLIETLQWVGVKFNVWLTLRTK